MPRTELREGEFKDVLCQLNRIKVEIINYLFVHKEERISGHVTRFYVRHLFIGC